MQNTTTFIQFGRYVVNTAQITYVDISSGGGSSVHFVGVHDSVTLGIAETQAFMSILAPLKAS